MMADTNPLTTKNPSSLKENEEKKQKTSKKFLILETFRIFAAKMEDYRYEE